jgi:hypothetical protein
MLSHEDDLLLDYFWINFPLVSLESLVPTTLQNTLR